MTETASQVALALQGRGIARASGLKRYFTGVPCARGHISDRYVSDAACRECKKLQAKPSVEACRERDRRAYAKNPEKFKERARAAYRNNPERKAAWLAANPSYQRDWYAKNAEREREKMRVRRQENPEQFAKLANARRARKASAEGSFTSEDIRLIREAQKDECAYCHDPLSGRGHVDHIQPLAKGGSNWPRNLQLLCAPCNLSKGDSDPQEFLLRRAA